MTTATTTDQKNDVTEREFATFHLGELLIGIDIRQIREINRHVEVTTVPHAHPSVRGVINLRGEVVTVIDLRTILELEPAMITPDTRNLIIDNGEDSIALLVDRIADVVHVQTNEIGAPPANSNGTDHHYFQGVVRLEKGLLIILNVNETVAVMS